MVPPEMALAIGFPVESGHFETGASKRAQAKKLFRNLLDLSATVSIEAQEVTVTLDKRAHNPYLVASGLAEEPTPMPWFGGRQLRLRFA